MLDLDSIYFAARELPPDERTAYLTVVCQDNTDLHTRVEQMLALSEEAEAFITDLPHLDSGDRHWGRGALENRSPDPDNTPDELVGQEIGRYKILERIGEGGCGVVYVAEQTGPVQRKVALKVIKLGLDSKQVVSRFEAERQALAMMDHPNIAKVFDADTTALGRPYFVMELVPGICITDYCNREDLTTNQRLDLFIEVCQAIQHAHQKGIIHRDIKPSNILVSLQDGGPMPKVIDFGIAKATEGRLSDATIFTQLHQFVGTPAYMSPEQTEMGGQDIDTRSDIYSLGVLLYELLAGSTPFDTKELLAAGIDAMRKAIREDEPLRPSTKLSQTRTRRGSGDSASSRRRHQQLMHQLKGDLDWIVMKCLEKNRTRRYETANALGMDIRRHLNMEPVVARPPSRLYKFHKTLRRHKFGVAVAFALLAALTAGVATSTWQAVRATTAQRVAQGAQAEAILQTKLAEQRLVKSEWLVYAGKLMLARSDFETGNGGLALHYLDECQPDLRGWEHRYLSARISPKRTLTGHRASVSGVAFSPDGQQLITTSADRTAIVRDAGTGQVIHTLKGHRYWLTCVAFSPDSTRIATGSGIHGVQGSETKVWDASTGDELFELKGKSWHTDAVNSVAFSPDGTRIATASEDDTSKVWDAVTGELIHTLEGHAGGVRCIAFSPDGARIVTGDEQKTATLWDARTGEKRRTLKKHASSVHGVAFSPDGTRIATASGDGTAIIWNAETGQDLAHLEGHAKWLLCVAFSPDGKRLATGGADHTVRVWDAITGEIDFVIKGHAGYVRSVAFSPDGLHIITGSEDATARVWNADKSQEVPTFVEHADSVTSIAFSSDGKRIATASQDSTMKLWNPETGEVIHSFDGHSGKLSGVAFSPDSSRIVTASDDTTAMVWDSETRLPIRTLNHTNPLTSVAFSPDGSRIVTGTRRDGEHEQCDATVWDAQSGQKLLPPLIHPHSVWSVAFSPDGEYIVTGCGDNTAKLWDANTGGILRTLERHNHMVTSVAFSPDGGRIVSGSADNTAKVWETATGTPLQTLEGHTAVVRSVAFSPDGNRIVTASSDQTAKVWEAATGLELLPLNGHEHEVLSVAFSPDGSRIATGTAGASATVRLWHAPPAAIAPASKKQ